MAVGRDELRTALDLELRVSAFKDYCPNGLQVEGRDEINVLVSLSLIHISEPTRPS